MFVDVDAYGEFKLGDDYLQGYRERPAEWGFGPLSWITFKRTYSRDGEDWWETCRRVIEGMFTVQRAHCRLHAIPWDEAEAHRKAEDAYARMWSFKWTPPGRGLWIMGTRFLYEHGGAALNNCGFVSTKSIDDDYAAPFVWLLSMSMLGVGVGFDTRGRGRRTIQEPQRSEETHTVGDSREGWVEALERLLNAYAGRGSLPASWDFSRIRPAGTPLKSFGGRASGPGALQRMLAAVDELHQEYVGKPVDSRLIVDAMNLVGRCVVAGGIRRSAQIALGDPDDERFLDLKRDAEKVSSHRWVSNNSVTAAVGMDYAEAVQRTAANGEPGYFWLENAQAYGRLCDAPDRADREAEGTNPCVEQTLWDRELCTLVETFPARHADREDFRETLRVAYEYAKTVTLVPTQDRTTNSVMLRNRRIGISMTGVVQAINRHGYRRFFSWCREGYADIRRLDHEVSRRLGVNGSIKTTTVKPSGTVSLLAGATPG
ncbi:MAG: fused protease/ribonucleoside-triphosphate reductase, partial [Candidatus Eisenbacteria bacterium]|nr:fused protease/ribonucleoside-triphosphate reductase [Candidatus Eisenbacteria bacterium]